MEMQIRQPCLGETGEDRILTHPTNKSNRSCEEPPPRHDESKRKCRYATNQRRHRLCRRHPSDQQDQTSPAMSVSTSGDSKGEPTSPWRHPTQHPAEQIGIRRQTRLGSMVEHARPPQLLRSRSINSNAFRHPSRPLQKHSLRRNPLDLIAPRFIADAALKRSS
jgi:hypothetical protein